MVGDLIIERGGSRSWMKIFTCRDAGCYSHAGIGLQLHIVIVTYHGTAQAGVYMYHHEIMVHELDDVHTDIHPEMTELRLWMHANRKWRLKTGTTRAIVHCSEAI